MSHTIYCDRCGRESRGDIEPHEERNILPGPAEHQDPYTREVEFIRLDKHRDDRIWCGPCWDEVTASEIDSSWKKAFLAVLGQTPRVRLRYWRKARCSICKRWVEVPLDCPRIETTRYTVLSETAGNPIDGWFFGVWFRGGKPLIVRCSEHVAPQKVA